MTYGKYIENTKYGDGVPINWKIPDSGTTGTIQNLDTSMFLAAPANWAPDNTAVTEDSTGQQWERSADDESGYFTLKNVDTGKYLTYNFFIEFPGEFDEWGWHLTVEGM